MCLETKWESCTELNQKINWKMHISSHICLHEVFETVLWSILSSKTGIVTWKLVSLPYRITSQELKVHLLEWKVMCDLMPTRFYEVKICLKFGIVLNNWWNESVSNLNKIFTAVYKVHVKSPLVTLWKPDCIVCQCDCVSADEMSQKARRTGIASPKCCRLLCK